MKNLINTISKELNANNLYLNHCSTEIQLLRVCKDLTPILKLKPLNSLKRIVNELLATKQEQATKMSKEFEVQAEIQANIEAVLQTIENEEKIMFDFTSSDEYRKANDTNPIF